MEVNNRRVFLCNFGLYYVEINDCKDVSFFCNLGQSLHRMSIDLNMVLMQTGIKSSVRDQLTVSDNFIIVFS